jgi:hypothetical protein
MIYVDKYVVGKKRNRHCYNNGEGKEEKHGENMKVKTCKGK